jgi:hypothetical protein
MEFILEYFMYLDFLVAKYLGQNYQISNLQPNLQHFYFRNIIEAPKIPSFQLMYSEEEILFVSQDQTKQQRKEAKNSITITSSVFMEVAAN